MAQGFQDAVSLYETLKMIQFPFLFSPTQPFHNSVTVEVVHLSWGLSSIRDKSVLHSHANKEFSSNLDGRNQSRERKGKEVLRQIDIRVCDYVGDKG